MAAIGHVFTISRVAEMLGEDEDWLYQLSIDMFPEDGCLRVLGLGDEAITAFTDYGVECLRQVIEDEKTFGRQPTSDTSIKPFRGSK